jgi:hypothetical protein
MIRALDVHGPGLRPAQGRQQQGRENGDDGDDYQQLNQRESMSPGGPVGFRGGNCTGSHTVRDAAESRRLLQRMSMCSNGDFLVMP